jgi:biotin transport system substrate-specific component
MFIPNQSGYKTRYGTIYDILFKQKNLLVDIYLVGLSVVFMALMANIGIPLWPVPITMQTFGVFVIALFFGSRKGFVAMLSYVLAGAVGLGVFARFNSGLPAIVGPTGGYIIGFLVCVYAVGWMIERGYGRTMKSVLACMIFGNAIIYIHGLTVLRFFMWDASLWELLMAGMVPFLVGDILKIVAAVALFPYLWKRSERLAS